MLQPGFHDFQAALPAASRAAWRQHDLAPIGRCRLRSVHQAPEHLHMIWINERGDVPAKSGVSASRRVEVPMMPAATRFLRTAFEGLRQSWERGAGPTFASNADLDIAARDLGVGPGQLRSLAAEGRHAADLLAVRLDVLGVQSGDLAPSVLRELEATCSHCDSKRQCRRDLAAGGPKLPSYCPNATVLSGTAAG